MKTLQVLLLTALIQLSVGLAVDWNVSPWSVKNPLQDTEDFEYEYIYDTLDEPDTEQPIDFINTSQETADAELSPRAEPLKMNTDKKYILRKILRKRKSATESYYNQQPKGKNDSKTKRVVKGTARHIVKSFLENMKRNKTENKMFKNFPANGSPNVIIEDLTIHERIPRKVHHLQNIQKLLNDRVLSKSNQSSMIEMLPTLPPPIHRMVEKNVSPCGQGSLDKIQQFINETKIQEETILKLLCNTFPFVTKVCNLNEDSFLVRNSQHWQQTLTPQMQGRRRSFQPKPSRKSRIVLKVPKRNERLRDHKSKLYVGNFAIFNPATDFQLRMPKIIQKSPIYREETDDWQPITRTGK